MLLITYNAACCLQLYRVTIKWNLPQTSNDAPPSATMTTSCLLKEDDCLPSRTSSSGGDTFATDLRDVPSQLTHLEFVPAAPEQGGGGPTPPTVIAAFASVSSNPTISLGTAHPQPTPTGIISRWELHQQTHGVLHGSFDQLTLKKKSTSAVGNRVSRSKLRRKSVIDAFTGVAPFCSSTRHQRTCRGPIHIHLSLQYPLRFLPKRWFRRISRANLSRRAFHQPV